MATSCIKSTAFATFKVIIDSGIRVQISPPTATMGTSENLQFTATVTGTSNTAVVWSVNNIPGGNATVGIICPNASSAFCTIGSPGEYFAPATAPGAVTITAQSGADPNQQGSAPVAVTTASAPAITNLDPAVAAEGSVQQDVYLTGTHFLSTSGVLVGSVLLPPANVTFLGGTLLRVTIPAAQLTQALPVQLSVQSQDATLTSGTVTLNVVPVRPALVASSPDSVQRTNGGASLNVNLTGGFFLPGTTTATFSGVGCGGGGQVCTTFVDSRHLAVTISDTSLSTPGLYPIIVQNADAALAGVPSISGLNLAVAPEEGSVLIPGAPIATAAVGSGPSAVAIDQADGIAVVTNASGNSVSLVSLATNSTIGSAIAVGNQPTGVAVDDLLTHPLALVVNSGDKTVSTVDLTTRAVVGAPLSVSIGPSATSPVPFSIGLNSLTHRAIVAYQSTNQATILDLSTGTPVVVQQIGGAPTPYSTGPNPAVAIDPRLNWALVTPGGAGTTNLVDLGRNGISGDVGRLPQVVGSLSISTTTQGIGINAETHQALLTNPQSITLTTFSLLDNTVTPVTFTNGGTPLSQSNLVAAAVNPLENVGIAVNGAASGATAVVVDLETGTVLRNVSGLGGTPRAVAVDPASNKAVVANQTDGTVSIVSLGPAPSSPQIVEASPAVAFGGPGTADLTLTITGAGFVNGTSKVLLDGSALPNSNVSVVSSRRIVATVPGGMLSAARRYLVQVQNSASSVSNVTDLAVMQAVSVGSAPVGVAVDTDRDLAVVSNSLDGMASLVSLAPPSPTFSPQSLGNVGLVGLPISVGTTPEGVAVLPRLGFALVTNNGSNNATFIDYSTGVPTTFPPIALCTGCAPAGVAINPDTAQAWVANTNLGNSSTTGSVSFFTLSATSSTAPLTVSVDPDPVAVAIDPTFNFAAVATASSASSIDFINLTNAFTSPGPPVRSGVTNPSGVVFDPVNQVFLVANSLSNNVLIIDPTTSLQRSARVGIEPTSLDYDFQTSTLVTVNAGSRTMSILDYTCPPSSTAPACPNPQVRMVLGLGGAQSSALVLGPNAVAIDPKLNLAVLVDADNNRVLLVPLPH
ncbi:MAG: IPT/TIG domain-containing protein [Acidobacteriia bacterium]|nr:IPT/TIG domain-containing protein [Terriglobia bacterium]